MSGLLRTNGVARLASRRIMQMQGADAARFVQAVLTNDMRQVSKPGDVLYGAFLTTKGRIVGDCNVLQVKEDAFLLDYDELVEEELLKHWKRYKLRMKVKFEDRSDSLSAFAAFPSKVEASNWDAEPVESDVDTIRSLNSVVDSSEGFVFEDPRGTEFGVRAFVPSDSKLNVPDSYENVDESTYVDHRILLGAAEGKELSEGIPLESNLELLHGVSFQKGCYVGQELTALTQFKRNVRKRFVPVALVPSSNGDAVKALSELTFQRFDAESNAALRQYLVEAHSWETADSPSVGDKIVKSGSSKAVGTIINVGKDVNAAVAMMRLEHLLPSESGELLPLSFSTADGRFQAVPFQPTWWPQMDASTGKMVI